MTIKEHKQYWVVIDKDSKFHEYHKDNTSDLFQLIDYLIEEANRANAKQECWFEKYWECKKQLNKITDVLNGHGDAE